MEQNRILSLHDKYRPANQTFQHNHSATIIQREIRKAYVREHVVPKLRYTLYLKKTLSTLTIFNVIVKLQCDLERKKHLGFEMFQHQPGKQVSWASMGS